MGRGKKTAEESSKPRILYKKKEIVYRPRIGMSKGSSSLSLIPPRKDGESSTTTTLFPTTQKHNSRSIQYGNSLDPILNKETRLWNKPSPIGNSIALSKRDLMLPEWIMKVLGSANFVYLCQLGNIWFTYGYTSSLYCIQDQIVLGGGASLVGMSLEHLLVKAEGESGNILPRLDGISGIAMDNYSNLFLLFYVETIYIQKYRIKEFVGVTPVIEQVYQEIDEEGSRLISLEMEGFPMTLKAHNHLEVLSMGNNNDYLMVKGYMPPSIAIFSYDPGAQRSMVVSKHLQIDGPVLNRGGSIYTITSQDKRFLYIYCTNTNTLSVLNEEFETIRSINIFVPKGSPVIFVSWGSDAECLSVFAERDKLPIAYEINSFNGALVRIIQDPLIQSLRFYAPLHPIFGFSKGPYGLYVYGRDRIVDITLF